MKEFKIVPIRNGSVLDHIEPGKALEVLKALGQPPKGSQKVVSLSMNLPSSRGANKDVLKFEDIELTASDLAKVKQVSKRGTLSVIRGYEVSHKESW